MRHARAASSSRSRSHAAGRRTASARWPAGAERLDQVVHQHLQAASHERHLGGAHEHVHRVRVRRPTGQPDQRRLPRAARALPVGLVRRGAPSPRLRAAPLRPRRGRRGRAGAPPDRVGPGRPGLGRRRAHDLRPRPPHLGQRVPGRRHAGRPADHPPVPGRQRHRRRRPGPGRAPPGQGRDADPLGPGAVDERRAARARAVPPRARPRRGLPGHRRVAVPVLDDVRGRPDRPRAHHPPALPARRALRPPRAVRAAVHRRGRGCGSRPSPSSSC